MKVSEVAQDLRGAVVLGVVQAVADGGQAQTVDAQTHDGVLRGGVEVMQPYGFASSPPAGGAVALLLAIGGDPGNMVALPVACPALRFGSLASGEAVLYGAAGQRVAARAGGLIEIVSGVSVQVKVGGVTFTVTPAGVTIAGPTTLTGDVGITGAVSITGSLKVNGHSIV